MLKKDRGNVWLAVAGIVIKEDKWLVVRKKYGGLKGKWSLPAGFVNRDETMDEAVVREVLEETGVETKVIDLVGIRSGVIDGAISDNMVIFLLEEKENQHQIVIQEDEIDMAIYQSVEQLKSDPTTSIMLQFYLEKFSSKNFQIKQINPGNVFRYTKYNLFY